MNCASLLTATGWKCMPSGVRAIRAVAPFSLGINGQSAAFYVAQPSDDTFYLTDASETAVHAEQYGIRLSPKRIQALNSTAGVSLAKFDSDGTIVAEGPIEDMPGALWDAVKLAMSLSFKTEKWRPKFAQAKFQAIVYAELEAQLGAERIIKEAKVQGASGHIIEFPFGVKRSDGNTSYVQPFAIDGGKINWAAIYQAQGKFFDVKAASDINNRISIIQDGLPKDEFGRVANFLNETSLVHTLAGTKDWAKVFA